MSRFPLSLKLDEAASLPLYEQLYRQLKLAIMNGLLPAGTRLPSSRQLAQQHNLARVTVTQAYEQLQVEGYIHSRPGAGSFVTDIAPLHETTHVRPELSSWGQRLTQHQLRLENMATASQSNVIDFGIGRAFSDIFPYDIWRKLLARYLSTDDAMLSRYGSVSGFTPLREAVADYLARLRGVNCVPEQVIIVNGVQQALDLLARLLLNPGDGVLVETPGYTDAYSLFTVRGARLLPLPVDDKGFPVERIPAGTKAKLVFVTPANQFPRGGTLPLNRRLALLRWAQEANALIIEDDYDGELRYGSRPVGSLQGLDKDGRVIYLGTFSKVLFPALRLGYIVLPPELVSPFERAKSVVDRGAPTLTQAAIADFITEGHFERHLRRLRRAYGERREALVTALQTHLAGVVTFSGEPAGLQILLSLPDMIDEPSLIQKANSTGVRVYPGANYHLPPHQPPTILLGFSGLNAADITKGVVQLAKCIETLAK